MATNRYTVVYESNDARFKLCRILLSSDGSYYVTCPYHVSDRVFVSKQVINYVDPNKRRRDPPIEFSLLDDDDHRLKLAHHPDGFIQFSGEGIISGRNPDGTPKGIGLQSWPLASPTAGPACSVCVQNPRAFKQADAKSRDEVVYKESELHLTDRDTGLVIEMYYFPGLWRRFVRYSGGMPILRFKHPSGAIIESRVCQSPPDNWNIGFLGIDLWPAPINLGETSGFTISSPSGELSYNDDNELEGKAIFATYPFLKDEIRSSFVNLHFQPKPDPPYFKDGPSPTEQFPDLSKVAERE